VLLRAAVIVEGVETVRARRVGVADRDLARGPGRLCRALGVDRSLDGTDVCDPASPLWLAVGEPVPVPRIATGPRVGIARAAERPWRYWIEGEPGVSAYKAGGRRRIRAEADPAR
jgi:DNA-3-methyladenine glycosylase